MGTSRIKKRVLEQLLTEIKAKGGTTIDAMEELEVVVAQEGIDNLLADLPPEEDSPKPCPFCGKAIPVHARGRTRTFEALSGKHTIYRNYHYCKSCKVGFYPYDDALGLPKEGSVSFNLEERLLDFAVTEVYDQCAERWEVHYPHRPFSENMFRLTTDRVGHRREYVAPCGWHVEGSQGRSYYGRRSRDSHSSIKDTFPDRPGIGLIQAGAQRDPGRPTKVAQSADIEKLLRGPVGHFRIELDGS